MRAAQNSKLLPVLSLLSLATLSGALVGCPEKGGAPAEDKATVEPERAEPDDDKGEAKKPASPPPPAPAAAPAADDKKPDDKEDDKGGW